MHNVLENTSVHLDVDTNIPINITIATQANTIYIFLLLLLYFFFNHDKQIRSSPTLIKSTIIINNPCKGNPEMPKLISPNESNPLGIIELGLNKRIIGI